MTVKLGHIFHPIFACGLASELGHAYFITSKVLVAIHVDIHSMTLTEIDMCKETHVIVSKLFFLENVIKNYTN